MIQSYLEERINTKNCFTFSNNNLLVTNDVKDLNIINTKEIGNELIIKIQGEKIKAKIIDEPIFDKNNDRLRS